jgi:hypothetical protein
MPRYVEWADPSGSYPANGTLVSLLDRTVYLFTFTEVYADLATNPFAGHLPGGAVVIVKCTDVTHVFLLSPGGVTDTIY